MEKNLFQPFPETEAKEEEEDGSSSPERPSGYKGEREGILG